MTRVKSPYCQRRLAALVAMKPSVWALTMIAVLLPLPAHAESITCPSLPSAVQVGACPGE